MNGTAVLAEQAIDGRVLDLTLGLDGLSTADLVTALRDTAVAAAVGGKDPDDVVPAAVWWLVVEALRRSLVVSGTGVARDRMIAAAVVSVETASWRLTEDVPLLLSSVGAVVPRCDDADPVRALRRAHVLVARLVLSPARTSPTLLQVRLDRLARALLAGLSPA
jgi:hypothetical protein